MLLKDNQSSTMSGPYCSICWDDLVDEDNPIEQCSVCNVKYHKLCYGAPTDQCFACRVKGTIVRDAHYPDGDLKETRTPAKPVRVRARPVDCCFCSMAEPGLAMHEVLDAEFGRYVLKRNAQHMDRPLMAHTLCARFLSEFHDDFEGTFLHQGEEKGLAFFYAGGPYTGDADKTCYLCQTSTGSPMGPSLVPCCANHDKEDVSFQACHAPGPCDKYVHVGCAMWYRDENGSLPRRRRVYLAAEEVDDVDKAFEANLFCDEHAEDLVKADRHGAKWWRYPVSEAAAAAQALVRVTVPVVAATVAPAVALSPASDPAPVAALPPAPAPVAMSSRPVALPAVDTPVAPPVVAPLSPPVAPPVAVPPTSAAAVVAPAPAAPVVPPADTQPSDMSVRVDDLPPSYQTTFDTLVEAVKDEANMRLVNFKLNAPILAWSKELERQGYSLAQRDAWATQIKEEVVSVLPARPSAAAPALEADATQSIQDKQKKLPTAKIQESKSQAGREALERHKQNILKDVRDNLAAEPRKKFETVMYEARKKWNECLELPPSVFNALWNNVTEAAKKEHQKAPAPPPTPAPEPAPTDWSFLFVGENYKECGMDFSSYDTFEVLAPGLAHNHDPNVS